MKSHVPTDRPRTQRVVSCPHARKVCQDVPLALPGTSSSKSSENIITPRPASASAVSGLLSSATDPCTAPTTRFLPNSTGLSNIPMQPHPLQFTKTLKVCCQRVDDKVNSSTRRRKQKIILREDLDQTPAKASRVSVSPTTFPQDNIVIPQFQTKKTDEARAKTDVTWSTAESRRDPSTALSATISCVLSQVNDTRSDCSFQKGISKTGHHHVATADKQTGEGGGNSPVIRTYPSRSLMTKGTFKITVPLYKYSPTTANKANGRMKRKGKSQAIKSTKRRLCSEAPDATVGKLSSVSAGNRRRAYPGILPYSYERRDPKRDHCTKGLEEIWLCPVVQIDTMGPVPSGGLTKEYSRAVIVCLHGSAYRPLKTASINTDAVNCRVTYDRDGMVAVIEPVRTVSAGIYRVVCTQVAHPHVCLKGSLAMEAELVPCTSIANLKPHSQYLVASSYNRIPRTQWRERLSATAVRLHIEDYLHTASFHKFALPLLLWNDEEDTWDWARDKPVKFASTKKRKTSARSVKEKPKAKQPPRSV